MHFKKRPDVGIAQNGRRIEHLISILIDAVSFLQYSKSDFNEQQNLEISSLNKFVDILGRAMNQVLHVAEMVSDILDHPINRTIRMIDTTCEQGIVQKYSSNTLMFA